MTTILVFERAMFRKTVNCCQALYAPTMIMSSGSNYIPWRKRKIRLPRRQPQTSSFGGYPYRRRENCESNKPFKLHCLLKNSFMLSSPGVRPVSLTIPPYIQIPLKYIFHSGLTVWDSTITQHLLDVWESPRFKMKYLSDSSGMKTLETPHLLKQLNKAIWRADGGRAVLMR